MVSASTNWAGPLVSNEITKSRKLKITQTLGVRLRLSVASILLARSQEA